MHVVVDYDLCEGNAVCEAISGEIFQVGEDDQVRLLLPEPGPEWQTAVEEAVRRCPKQALSVED